MKILFITYRLPNPKMIDGYSIRVLNIAKILKKSYRLDLISIYGRDEELKYKDELKKIFEKIFLFKKNIFFKALDAIKGIFTLRPIQENIYFLSKMKKWIKKNYKNYDLVFCNTLRTVKYVFDLKIKKVVDLIESLSLKYKEAMSFVNFFWKIVYKIEIPRVKKVEKEILNNFDKVFISSDFDKKYLNLNSKLVTIPNGVKEELIGQTQDFPEGSENYISFFGKMSHQPNEDAAIFFSKKIMPLIASSKNFHNLKFYILGTNPTRKVKKLASKNIVVAGYLKNPYQIIKKSKLIVVPLRFGAGIQNKILEAMVLKKAVLTSKIGARGIDGKDGKHFLVAQNPQEFFEKIIFLLKNEEKRKNLGENARRLILEKYTWEKVEEKLNFYLKEILK